MTGRELMEILQGLSTRELELPVVFAKATDPGLGHIDHETWCWKPAGVYLDSQHPAVAMRTGRGEPAVSVSSINRNGDLSQVHRWKFKETWERSRMLVIRYTDRYGETLGTARNKPPGVK